MHDFDHPGHGEIHVRREQACDEDGCQRPARYGWLCAACFMAATPARRAVELLALDRAQSDELEALWRLPTVEPRQAA
jgi:hypothetical protein